MTKRIAVLVVGFVLTACIVVPTTASNLKHSDIVEAPAAIDLQELLGDGITVRVSAGAYLPPLDRREADYNKLRSNMNALSDANVLIDYQENWLKLAEIKDASGGRALPRMVAEHHAMELHAAWREIQQRGLIGHVNAPQFDAIWNFLLVDTDTVKQVSL